ncbi:MAG: CotH kinase family protein [Phycisphaerae bacterium]|nr:CotH kinase family protein [Phycisphaerae bacterium]
MRKTHNRWTHRLNLFLMGCLVVAFQTVLRAQDFVITEFAAVNTSGLQDEDGDFSDWIEIYNADQAPASLLGWYLTNNFEDPSQWEFPDVIVPGQGFVVVFASGKDRQDPAASLHTNFKLNRDGEYLALVHPDGVTVASEFAPVYPRQISNVTYGTFMAASTTSLVDMEAVAQFLVPNNEALGTTWTRPEFDASAWSSAIQGLGYDRPDTHHPMPEDVPLTDVTNPDDFIDPTSFNSPANEDVAKAIDNNPQTKYLNFDKLYAGFTVRTDELSVVEGLRLTSANDAPDRDPTTFVLSGSLDGQTFVPIAAGNIPNFSNRFMTMEIRFANDRAYTHYRLLFPTVRQANAAVAMQIAEVEFLGRMGPAPIAFSDVINTDLETALFGRQTSVYVRLPFAAHANQPLNALALHVRYDDGFVAYLNSVEVARSNAPDTLDSHAAALEDRPRSEAVIEERFSLTEYTDLIQPGMNVLALHALNDWTKSPDFLIQAWLENTDMQVLDTGYFDAPTPGQVNSELSLDLVADPVFDWTRGFYDMPVDVTIQSATPDAQIRYTTDGSVPTETHGRIALGPVHIDRTTTLRAAAFREAWRPSRVVTQTYLFLDDIVQQDQAQTLAAGLPASWNNQPADYGLDTRVIGKNSFNGKYAASLKDDLKSLPSMSLVMDVDDLFGTQGIYANPTSRGDNWERRASLELIYPDGQEGFHVNAGIRIQGGAFRRFDLTLKKSFRVIFREEYGAARLNYPLFGPDAVDSFDNITLRANSNDAWKYGGGGALYVRDAFAMDTIRDMGNVSSHSIFVHLYINGFYWGVYNPVERPDAAFSASYHGGVKDTWDAINQDSTPDGNYDAWNRMLNMLKQDVTDSAVYQKLQGNNPDGTRNWDFENLLDVDNMIDYMIMNFYVGNTDWPHRNWYTGRDREGDQGFQFYPWDTETALSGLGTDRTGVTGAVATPYAALRANAQFRQQFGDHVYKHIRPGGALYVNPLAQKWDRTHPENNRPAERFAALADEVFQAVVGESARWGDQLNNSPYTRDEHWLGARDNLLNNYFPFRTERLVTQLRNAGLYPHIDPPTFNQSGGPVDPGFELAMTAPKGTIYYTTNGDDPLTPVEIETVFSHTLMSTDSVKKVLVPSVANGGSTLGTTWLALDGVDDSHWMSGTSGVGYDNATDYLGFIGIDVTQDMRGKNNSVYIRIPFDLDNAMLNSLNSMTLRMRYDDGFAAYLNGTRIASANAPGTLTWNATSTANQNDAQAILYTDYDLGAFIDLLQPGQNLLAIQGLNVSLNSSDFLIDTELVVAERHIISEEPTALKYTQPIVLDDLTTIKTRAFDGQEWSALNQATFTVGQPRLVITELNYHPSDPTPEEISASFALDNDFEFVELVNAGLSTLDLAGARFTDGIEFDFSEASVTLMAPGQIVLLVANDAAFDMRYGPDLPVIGQYSGKLSNAGEHLEIMDAQGNVLTTLTYGTSSPWPTQADGQGPSLELMDRMGQTDTPENWQASGQLNGTPGQ